MNQESRKLWDLPHYTATFCLSTREFALDKLHNVKNLAQPPTLRDGAVKSHDLRDF
jgi:hypothetical protein